MHFGSAHLGLVVLAITVLLGFRCPVSAQTVDDAEMVLIPAGPFTIGSEAKAIDEDAAEKPPHQVDLPAFYIDRLEVTNAQFASFLNEPSVRGRVGTRCVGQRNLQLQQVEGVWQPNAGLRSSLSPCHVVWPRPTRSGQASVVTALSGRMQRGDRWPQFPGQ